MNTLRAAAAEAIPLHVVPTRDFDSFSKAQPPLASQWLRQLGDAPEAGRCAVVPDANGAVAMAVVIGEPEANPWLLAAIRSQLPPLHFKLVGVPPAAANHQARGWGLDGYTFDRYRKAGATGATLEAEDAVLAAEIEATATVRDLVNTPTEDLGPDALATHASRLAEQTGGAVEVIVGDELLEQNYPAIHAVGRAAARAPRLIRLTWSNPGAPHVILVGKGVCFDTGGLNLKPAAGMRLMKKDMGGAAHVLGLAQLLQAMAAPIALTVLIPAVENAVAGNAYRPGDVVSTRRGLSVEIGNTDAEGRVILADALTRAGELKPDLVIDFATLTGAARIALGPDLPALYARRDATALEILTAGTTQHDPLWRMPLHGGYADYLKSPLADLSNIASSPMGGSITAALFLDRFVDPELDWVHVDVYAWNQKARPGRPEGGEAQGMRAMYHALMKRFGEE